MIVMEFILPLTSVFIGIISLLILYKKIMKDLSKRKTEWRESMKEIEKNLKELNKVIT